MSQAVNNASSPTTTTTLSNGYEKEKTVHASEEVRVGGELVPHSLIELLMARQVESSAKPGFSWIEDSGKVVKSLRFKELELEARSVAVSLIEQEATGQRVLLLFEPSLQFLIGFFGCVYAGAIAVPLYPPVKDEDFHKVR